MNYEFKKISREYNRFKRSLYLSSFKRKYAQQWSGYGDPGFEWMDRGKIGKLKRVNPIDFDEFIDLNSDKLVRWDPVRYLGSGVVGDAWELSDGTVLKIFNKEIKIGKETDLQKYKKIMEQQHAGVSFENVPMIYECGEFEIPDNFYVVERKNRDFANLEYIPAYVVMEKVEMLNSRSEKYLSNMPFMMRMDNESRFDQHIEGQDKPPLDISKVPSELVAEISDYIENNDYPGMIQAFVNSTIDSILDNVSSYFDYLKFDYDQSVRASLAEEYFDAIVDFSRPDIIQYLSQKFKESIYDGESHDYYSRTSLKELERILNLPSNWLDQLCLAAARNLMNGRRDLHSQNFGMRNGKFVFFDA